MKIAISVIIPSYKPGDYIFENLGMLRQQTIDHGIFEVLIILNGPKEPYYTEIEAYIRKCTDLNVRLVYTEKKGVAHARNEGVDIARGQYIAFFDDDDWVSPTYLENLYAGVDGEAIVVSNVKLVDETTGHQLAYYLTDAFDALEGKENPSLFQARSFLSAPWGKLIPRQVIGRDRFPDGYAPAEDSVFMFTISRRISSLRLAPRDTVYYVRYRSESASHQHRNYWQLQRILSKVTLKYTSDYLRAPLKYSFPLYLSRVIATVRKMLKGSYEGIPAVVSTADIRCQAR